MRSIIQFCVQGTRALPLLILGFASPAAQASHDLWLHGSGNGTAAAPIAFGPAAPWAPAPFMFGGGVGFPAAAVLPSVPFYQIPGYAYYPAAAPAAAPSAQPESYYSFVGDYDPNQTSHAPSLVGTAATIFGPLLLQELVSLVDSNGVDLSVGSLTKAAEGLFQKLVDQRIFGGNGLFRLRPNSRDQATIGRVVDYVRRLRGGGGGGDVKKQDQSPGSSNVLIVASQPEVSMSAAQGSSSITIRSAKLSVSLVGAAGGGEAAPAPPDAVGAGGVGNASATGPINSVTVTGPNPTLSMGFQQGFTTITISGRNLVVQMGGGPAKVGEAAPKAPAQDAPTESTAAAPAQVTLPQTPAVAAGPPPTPSTTPPAPPAPPTAAAGSSR